MKRFLVFLLLLVLIMAFAMPAAAVDVKFSGQYYAQGWYVDNPSVLDKNETAGAASWANNSRRGPNAWYSQRFRLTTEFQVVEGLKLVTRFDAMEKRWGDQAWAGSTGETQSRLQNATGTRFGSKAATASNAKAQENIEWERAYLDFNVPFGKFQVGYMQYLTWGTAFLDTTLTAGGIRYFYTQGPLQAVAAIEKRAEYVGSNGGVTQAIGSANDADKDLYNLGLTYKLAPGQIGLLYQYMRSAQGKYDQQTAGTENGYLSQLNGFYPYAQLTFGKLFFEVEGVWITGGLRSFESTTMPASDAGAKASDGSNAQNVSLNAYAAYVHGKYDFKPVYVGAKFVYVSGDDNSNSDKASGSILQSLQMNRSFYPTLILWNDDYQNNTGNIQGNIPTGATGTNRRTGQTYAVRQEMDNVWFYQIYAGFKPMPKLDVKASFSIASADKAPKSDVGTVGQAGYYTGAAVQEFVSTKYGNELDLTCEYKIYDNLTYMIGAGYLWTGDYFKGYDNSAVIKDNYLLTHKLTLNF